MTTREERVLAIPSSLLAGKLNHGFLPIRYGIPNIFGPANVTSMLRTDHEENEEFRALVAYIMVEHWGWYYSYERAKGSDPRLQARRSIGFGGHSNTQDADDSTLAVVAPITKVLKKTASREMGEEFDLRGWQVDSINFELMGLLNDESNKVGRTHLGFVYLVRTPFTDIQFVPEAKAKKGKWMSPTDLWDSRGVHEHWSKILIEEAHLIPSPNTSWRTRV